MEFIFIVAFSVLGIGVIVFSALVYWKSKECRDQINGVIKPSQAMAMNTNQTPAIYMQPQQYYNSTVRGHAVQGPHNNVPRTQNPRQPTRQGRQVDPSWHDDRVPPPHASVFDFP